MNIARTLTAVVLLVAAATAMAADVSFTYPTQNTDGTTIPATGKGALASSKISHGPCLNGALVLPPAGTVALAAGVTAATVPDVVDANTCVNVTVTNGFGKESAPANGMKVFVAPTPNAPTMVTIRTAALRLKITKDGPRFVRTSDVPLGVTCDKVESNKPWLGMYEGKLVVCGPKPADAG